MKALTSLTSAVANLVRASEEVVGYGPPPPEPSYEKRRVVEVSLNLAAVCTWFPSVFNNKTLPN